MLKLNAVPNKIIKRKKNTHLSYCEHLKTQNYLTLQILDKAVHFWRSDIQELSQNNIYQMSCVDVGTCRIKIRNRQNSLAGSDSLNYRSYKHKKETFYKPHPELWYNGQEKWDRLKKNMSICGWLKTHPLVLMINTHRYRLRDGHHRIGIALDLGIKICPVCIEYK